MLKKIVDNFWFWLVAELAVIAVALIFRKELPTWTLIIGLPALFIINMELRWTGQFCHISLTEGKSIYSEWCLIGLRIIDYVIAVVLMMEANGCFPWDIGSAWFPAMDSKWLRGSVFLVFSIVLWLDFCQTLFLLTFRKWSSYAISTAGVLLFLVFMGLPYAQSNEAWGLVSLTPLIGIMDRLFRDLTGKLVALTAAGGLVIYIVKSFFQSQRKKLYGGMIKDTRKSLLSHWHFDKDIPILTNSVVWVVFVASLCCVFAVFLSLSQDNGGKRMDVDTKFELATTNYADRISIEDIVFEVSQETKNTDSNILPYVAVLASLLACIGFAGYWTISDTALMADEYYYLLYHAIFLSGKRVNDERAASKWEDYFQVLAYLYIGMSSVHSEARAWHNVVPALLFVYKGRKGSRPEAEKAEFLSRFIYAYEQVKKQYHLGGETEYGTPENNRMLYNPLSEQLFSSVLQKIIDNTP